MKNLLGWRLGDAISELLNWCCPCCHNGQVIMRVVPNSVIPLRIIDNGQIREGAPEFVCKKCGKKLELGAFLNKYGYRIMFDCRTREFRLSK